MILIIVENWETLFFFNGIIEIQWIHLRGLSKLSPDFCCRQRESASRCLKYLLVFSLRVPPMEDQHAKK